MNDRLLILGFAIGGILLLGSFIARIAIYCQGKIAEMDDIGARLFFTLANAVGWIILTITWMAFIVPALWRYYYS
jgi:hypothetical protein